MEATTKQYLPPHIVRLPGGVHRSGHGSMNGHYVDMLNDRVLQESEIKDYVASLTPMVYWTTWAKYQQQKAARNGNK